MSSRSCGLMPATGSSSSSSCGLLHEQHPDLQPLLLAVAERAGRPVGRPPSRPIARASRRPPVADARAAGAAARASGRRNDAARSRFSTTVSASNTVGRLEAAADAQADDAGARAAPVMSRPVEAHLARRLALVSPVTTSTSVVLPAPFGPIRKRSSPCCDARGRRRRGPGTRRTSTRQVLDLEQRRRRSRWRSSPRPSAGATSPSTAGTGRRRLGRRRLVRRRAPAPRPVARRPQHADDAARARTPSTTTNSRPCTYSQSSGRDSLNAGLGPAHEQGAEHRARTACPGRRRRPSATMRIEGSTRELVGGDDADDRRRQRPGEPGHARRDDERRPS